MMDMHKINPDGTCGGTIQVTDADHLQPGITDIAPPATAQGEEAIWAGSGWIVRQAIAPVAPSAPAALPTLKITAIAADATHAASTAIAADFSEVTCPAGTTLTVTAKLVDSADATIPLTGSFRMPLIASDGRERIVGVAMTAGVASIDVPLAESGVWAVTQGSVNRDLPAAQNMAFAGAKVYVTL